VVSIPACHAGDPGFDSRPWSFLISLCGVVWYVSVLCSALLLCVCMVCGVVWCGVVC
jgi:hypothetical protein